MGGTMTGTTDNVTIAQPKNPWARISDIAAKVGVGPRQFGDPATITCLGADGNSYDLWAVVEAVLNKMDAAVSAGERNK